MKKIHYSPKGRKRTACGQWRSWGWISTDSPSRVTCSNCIRSIKAQAQIT